jgi:hypothetical protein
VFHDHLLASDMRKIEQRYRLGHEHGLARAFVKAIHDRYEFSSPADSITITAAGDTNHIPQPSLSVT